MKPLLMARTGVVYFLLMLTSMTSAYPEVLSTTFYHNDLLGSPIAATNENGNLKWREEYRPFGERLLNEGVASDNTRWYTGHPQDEATGLVYAGARYYDPVVGRFMGIDPVGFVESNPASFNRYAYANNNPYKYVDQDGEYLDLAIEVASISIGVYGFQKNFRSGNYGAALLDAGGVALDTALAAVPVLPGGAGLAIKGSREAAEATTKTLAKGCCCFEAGTPVLTDSGLVAIETLKVGELVYALNTDTGEKTLKPISQVYITEGKTLYELILEDGAAVREVIHVTDNHPYWVKNKGWIDSSALKPGMEIKNYKDGNLTVVSINILQQIKPTYNLEVKDFHTYYAGKLNALVHNCSCVTKGGQLGQGLKNIREITSGRLKGFSRGNTELPGGTQGAKDLFKQLTGSNPKGGFDRIVLDDGREVLFRGASKSGPSKIEVVNPGNKFLEKISFPE